MAKKEKYDDKDKAYAAERNKLIPEAEAYANKRCGEAFQGGSDTERIKWNSKWSRTFLRHMDKLYRERTPCPTCGRKGSL